MTDFNYFDDWGLDGGWDAIQNNDYAPLWDSFNTGVTAQVPSFQDDTDYWSSNKPDLSFGGDIPNYQYITNNDAYNTYQTPGYKPSPMLGQLGQAVQSGGPMPEWMNMFNRPDNAQYNTAQGSQWTDMDQSSGGIFDQITGAVNKIGEFGTKNKDLLRLIISGYGAYKQQDAADRQRDQAMEMISRFGNPYVKQYAAQHYNYAQNPGEFYKSPVVQEQYRQAQQEYLARMAAQGRTNPNEIGLTSAKMLNDIVGRTYMPWMQTSYPWGQENQNLISPYSELMARADQNEYNKYNGVLEWLARMSGIPQEDIGTTQRSDNDQILAQLRKLLEIA